MAYLNKGLIELGMIECIVCCNLVEESTSRNRLLCSNDKCKNIYLRIYNKLKNKWRKE